MRNLSIAVTCIIALSYWLWKQSSALQAELESLKSQRSGLSETSSRHSEFDHEDSVIQISRPAMSTIEEATSELSRYLWGNSTKHALLGDEIFKLEQDQLPEVLEILTDGPLFTSNKFGIGASALQALFEHWSRLDLQEAKAIADTLAGDSKTVALRGILMHLIDTDLDAAIELASSHPIKSRTVGMGEMLSGPVIAEIAKRDPQKAAEFVKNGDPSDEMTSGMFTVTRIWAETDPLAALEWIQQQADWGMKSMVIANVHTNWAKSDPKAAIDSALLLEDSNAREDSLGAVIGEWAHQDEEAALTYLTNGLPESDRSVSLFERAGAFFCHASLDSVLGAAQRIDDIELREGFISRAAERRSDYDGNALELASHLREGALKDRVFESVMKNWVQFDLKAASDWLGAMQDSPSRDVAVRALTDKLVDSDPERAIQWAASIANTEQREKSIESLAEEWLKNDSETAIQWIEQTGTLSQTTKDRILR